jgi:molybdate transport system substrate-binding protein
VQQRVANGNRDGYHRRTTSRHCTGAARPTDDCLADARPPRIAPMTTEPAAPPPTANATTPLDRDAPPPLRGVSSMAMRHALGELIRLDQSRSGRRTTLEATGGVDALRRVRDGEAFDFVVLADDAIARLVDAGRVDAASRRPLARSAIGVAVPAGVSRVSIATEAAVRDALLGARAIGYSTGPSGTHLADLLARWGVADTLRARLVQAPPGVPVATLVARREVDIGVQQLGELMNVADVEILGLLPDAIQHVTVFSGAVCTLARRPHAAADLLAFLASPAGDAIKRRHGLEPA